MPSVKVDIDYDPITKKIEYPSVIGVRSGTIVHWRLTRARDLVRYYGSSLLLSIYFDDESPFKWNKLSSNQFYKPNIYRNFLYVEGMVEQPGEYKYGIKTETNPGDILFDEDPTLIVY